MGSREEVHLKTRAWVRGNTEEVRQVGSHIPSKPLLRPRPCLDTRAWRDPRAPVHNQREFPFSSHNTIHCNHWRIRLLLKRNAGFWCNYAFLTIENLDAGNSCCYHCFSNMHLKCSTVNTGWCPCLNGIFPVLWVQYNGVHLSFNNLTFFFIFKCNLNNKGQI